MATTAGQLLEMFQREAAEYPADGMLALQWLRNRYAQILERAPFTFLQKEATFNTTAEITAGTVTVTLGSATVTETTSNANGWSSSVANRYFRRDGDNEFYLISSFGDTNPDTLTLSRVYEGSSGTSKGYAIFQRLYSLASDVRELVGPMVDLNSGQPIEEVSQADFDLAMTNRPAEGSPPYWFAHAGLDSSNLMQVELYPIPDEAHGILYRYIQTTPAISGAGTTILPQVDQRMLRAGWLADYWSWRAASSETADLAVNMSGKYEREFERAVNELMLKEVQNRPPQKLKFARRLFAHRRGKFETTTRNVRMP